jgi:hypothetical protein
VSLPTSATCLSHIHCFRENLSNDTEDLLTHAEEDARRLNALQAGSGLILPGLNLSTDDAVRAFDLPIGGDFDYTGMIAIRREHETAYAKTANRRGVADKTAPSDADEHGNDGPSDTVVAERARLRLEFLREVNAILKEVNTQADGSGKLRNDRWVKAPRAAKGNTANAALAAGARATKVCPLQLAEPSDSFLTHLKVVSLRAKIFNEENAPLSQALANGGVGHAAPLAILKPGSFMFVYDRGEVYLAEGECQCILPDVEGVLILL